MVKLHLSTDQFDAIWAAVDKCRGKVVKVSRDELAALLMDHSKLIDMHKGKVD